MKKLLILLTVMLLVSGCSVKQGGSSGSSDPEPKGPALQILAPKGAPALSLLAYENAYGPDSLTLVDGSDLLQAAFANPSPEYDVIIAPLNLGAKLMSSGNTEYRLAGVVTWGNLYLVVNDALADDTSLPVALFGEGAVPEKVLVTALDADSVFGDRDILYLPSVAEVQGQLLAEKSAIGLVAEPALSALLIKAAQSNMSFSILADLQVEWKNATGSSNYPQAGVFVLPKSVSDKADAYSAFIDALTAMNVYAENPEGVEALLAGKEDLFGTPAAAVIVSAWPKMNIAYKPASECVSEMNAFLQLFNINDVAEYIIK
ncbi:MAG: hypothetical protein LBR25_07970 [Erysipelotrichaceae bacterium]|nr:hypothetical protein [Erysipelotrichaceae bacterium]